MGKSSKGTKGYKYFTSLVLMLGNRIECLLGVNFDKKGWVKPNNLKTNIFAGSHLFDYPELYGETEGGVRGIMSFHSGEVTQMPDLHYQEYFPLAPAYRHQSYVVFKDFYVGSSPYLKDVMFWPKRIHVKNDGSVQWHDDKSEIGFNKEYSVESGYFILDGMKFNVDQTKLIPAGVKLEIKADCSGGIIGDYNYEFETRGINKGVISDETKKNYGLYEIFKDSDVVTDIYTNGGAYHLEHANARFPNWDSLKNRPMHNSVKIHSVGFSALFLIKISSRTLQKNLNIKFSSKKSYVLKNIKKVNDTVGYGEVSYLSIIIAKDDLALIDFETENDQSAGMNLSIETLFNFQVCSMQVSYDSSVSAPDINPIHKAREIITDYTAMGKPESDINDENFRAAADRIYDEGLGISWAIQEKSCKEALQELEAHIEGGFRINRQTGLYECVLFRDDLLDLENALHFDESSIKTVEFDTINADDAINSYNVSYYDRENLKDSTFSIDDVGLIHTVGHVNAEKLDFPYFMNRRNAEIVANWKLKQASTAAWKGSFTTGRYDARKINKYDVVLLSWQSKQLVKIPVRVLNISLGDGVDNTVTIDFIEIVSYSENMNATINSDESMNTVLEPQQNNAVVFEAPYYELVQENGQANVNLELENNAEAGYLMTAVSKPQNNSIYALLYTDKATQNYETMEKVGYVDYCPSLTLDPDISFADSVFSVRNATEISLAKVGTLILLDDELLIYQSYDAATHKLTVKRGALDTVPKPHLKDAVFYFFDEFRFIDTEQYVASETVQAQVLTTTPSAVQKRELVDVKKLELNARAIRPYPPANVKINDEYYPAEIESDLVLTWVNRNRLQQTGGEILGFFDGGVTLENGVNYQLTLTEFDENQVELRTQSINVGQLNSYTFAASAMQANTFAIEITLKSIRDSYESFQFFTHTVELSRFYSAPYDLTVEFKND